MSGSDHGRVVLLIDSDAVRRQKLGSGLSEVGYEVVQTVDAAEGTRYAEALQVPLVVLHLAALGSVEGLGGFLGRLPASRVLLLTAGTGALAEEELGDEVRLVDVAETTPEQLVDRVRLVLLGVDFDLEPTEDLSSLVGDFNHLPLLALVRRLGRQRYSGRVLLERGEMRFWQGRPVDARFGGVEGEKAFARLATAVQGTFRLVPGGRSGGTSLDAPLDDLLFRAVRDGLGRTLARDQVLNVRVGKGLFRSDLTPLQRNLLARAENGVTVREVLDEADEMDGVLTEELLFLLGEGLLTTEERRRGVAIVTDSTADLPRDVVRSRGIEVVPLSVVLDGRVYQDGLDLDTGRFYELLPTLAEHPSTSPPSARTFADRFVALRRDGAEEVIALHISGVLSDTSAHAVAAANEVGGEEPVRVLDTRQVSLPLGMLAVLARGLADSGMPARDIVGKIRDLSVRMRALFLVDTLDYLVSGGRIGRTQGMVGKLLGIKPILSIRDGEIVAVDRARGGRAAQKRMVELFLDAPGRGRPVLVGIVHSSAPVWADRLRQLLTEAFDVRDVIVSEIGPVVGSHTGPGTVGAVLLPLVPGEDLSFRAPGRS